ncbi:30567_t:CDS:2, partial [Gigaspora margarita]
YQTWQLEIGLGYDSAMKHELDFDCDSDSVMNYEPAMDYEQAIVYEKAYSLMSLFLKRIFEKIKKKVSKLQQIRKERKQIVDNNIKMSQHLFEDYDCYYANNHERDKRYTTQKYNFTYN